MQINKEMTSTNMYGHECSECKGLYIRICNITTDNFVCNTCNEKLNNSILGWCKICRASGDCAHNKLLFAHSVLPKPSVLSQLSEPNSGILESEEKDTKKIILELELEHLNKEVTRLEGELGDCELLVKKYDHETLKDLNKRHVS